MTIEVVADRYRIVRALGHGATGQVFLVEDEAYNLLALKLLRDFNASRKRKAMEQFENEFKILSRLRHPMIARILDYGLDRRLNKVYFTMPHIEGCDLAIATDHKSVSYCLMLFRQILKALDDLHTFGITHGDLKPSNILVRQDDQIHLIDFGYADYQGFEARGTPMYMAPELFQGERHTPQSDLYALGVMFYFCLIRHFPFRAESTHDVIHQKLCETAHIQTFNPGIKASLYRFIMRLMAQNPDHRFSSASDALDALCRLDDGLSVDWYSGTGNLQLASL